ncbi:DNA mismatch repair protein Mlh3 isoform X1 [Myripristis murdjan]|uniref:DNA mismatch repair protein Mlh3 isoform X1 n=1 Tax=Myripristis murdjan TaxID=586833 RepID=UPI001175CBE2|nr:DNA mismatch repair protein Mlh3 isoform X1 [Myripristis murdjan]
MIKCLSKEVQGKLRSGVAISSLQQCVEELLLNSIDAGATCVGVRMDMEAFKVQVIDNGSGMKLEDMEHIGSRYHTSKCSCVEDLENLRYYGFRGEAVASIVSMATLVEISSRAKSSVKTHVKIFKDGKALNVFEAETARPSAGTTFVICNFFYNMPVRRKRLDPVLEGERIRHRVEAISLMHPSVSFTLKNDCTGAMLVQLSKARNTYHRFVQIHGLGRAQKLREISHTHGQFEVMGYIGREGHYNNSLQFLYVNDRLLLKTRIHKLLNLLLRKLRSSNQKNDSPDGPSAIRSPKHKRSQEMHGLYIINIKCPYSEYDVCLEPAKSLIEFKDWDGILLCIEEAVKVFLNRENLVVELSQDDLEYACPRLFGVAETDQQVNNDGEGVQATIGYSSLECISGRTLASEPVHRKHKQNSVSENSVGQTSECTVAEEESLGERRIIASELDSKQSDACIDQPRAVPQCDSVTLPDGSEPSTDSNIAEEEELAFRSVEENCQGIESTPSSVSQPESEQLRVTIVEEMRLNSTASSSNVSALQNVTQEIQLSTKEMLPNCQSTNGHEETVVDNRKISLSDPYIHENLQAQDVPLIIRPQLHQHLGTVKCEESSCASKRKISLIEDSSHIKATQQVHKDLAPVIPSKIPKLTSCQKLSLCKEAGSLDRFRRIYGKSNELKSSSLGTCDKLSLNDAKASHTHSFDLNPQNVLACQEASQEGDVIETPKTQTDLKSPPTLSVFTKVKPASTQNRARGVSLAAKLCHLKQHRTEATRNELTDSSRATSTDDTHLISANDSIQDDNNNEHPCDATGTPEPVPSCNTIPLSTEREEATASSDWLQHYDTHVGKIVYVNKKTGLSRYEDPPVEETQVHCTSDVTNMAVSVISKSGIEYRCYPFQTELVLPFLPKSKADRVISSGPEDRGDGVEDSSSLSSLYSKWENPVFVRPPMVGVDISSGQGDGLAVKIHNILFPYRFSKAMIHSMKVIHQVDKKFLACLINTRDQEPANTDTEGNLLVLVDQHAAHERVRLENLVADSYEDDPDAPGERRLCSSTILPPLEISVTEEELRLLGSCQPHLRSLGLEVEFSQKEDPHVLVGKVPRCFTEKESNETRRGRPSVIKPIVEEYLREQIELLRSTGRVRGTLPLTVLKVLASLACHGAIKFNDSLSRDECCSLVASLSSCQLPFQCAHGRPSIAPLVDILHLDKDYKESLKPNLQKLRRMYKAWKLFGNN